MPPIQTPFGSFTAICRMIRIEHSVFALPYAYAGAVLAAGGMPSWGTLIALTVAMIGVRSFAMAFNRIMDLPFDSETRAPGIVRWSREKSASNRPGRSAAS